MPDNDRRNPLREETIGYEGARQPIPQHHQPVQRRLHSVSTLRNVKESQPGLGLPSG
jgi:hypothetical protein